MGGQSFKCPLCDVWKLDMGAMRDHWLGKHRIKDVKCTGVAGGLRIISSNSVDQEPRK